MHCCTSLCTCDCSCASHEGVCANWRYSYKHSTFGATWGVLALRPGRFILRKRMRILLKTDGAPQRSAPFGEEKNQKLKEMVAEPSSLIFFVDELSVLHLFSPNCLKFRNMRTSVAGSCHKAQTPLFTSGIDKNTIRFNLLLCGFKNRSIIVRKSRSKYSPIFCDMTPCG